MRTEQRQLSVTPCCRRSWQGNTTRAIWQLQACSASHLTHRHGGRGAGRQIWVHCAGRRAAGRPAEGCRACRRGGRPCRASCGPSWPAGHACRRGRRCQGRRRQDRRACLQAWELSMRSKVQKAAALDVSWLHKSTAVCGCIVQKLRGDMISKSQREPHFSPPGPPSPPGPAPPGPARPKPPGPLPKPPGPSSWPGPPSKLLQGMVPFFMSGCGRGPVPLNARMGKASYRSPVAGTA